jgi:sugar lactone lactonase YvrE
MDRFMHAIAVACVAILASAGVVGADDHARVVIPFDPEQGEVAEGVAVDAAGNVFTGISGQARYLRLLEGNDEAESFRVIPGLEDGDFGLTGLAFNGAPSTYMYGLYSAVVSANPELNGVLYVDPMGRNDPDSAWWHIDGTEAMSMPNAIAFDGSGEHMYVTDSAAGAVWHLQRYGFVGYAEPELWISHPLLEGTGDLPFPFPVGANGIAVRDRTVYVANTERSTVVAIPILSGGAAGEPFVYAELPGVAADGIAFDADGNLYVADPSAHTLWEYAPDGTLTVVADVDDGLSGPSSVALWEDSESGELVAYVSNQAIGPPDTIKHGPSILAVNLE